MSCVTNPISSNQITDITILPPDCLGLCSSSDLNDWLKAISEKLCECNYENFDLSPIQSLLQQEPTNLTQCVILESLVEAIETLNTNQEQCCEEVEYSIPEVDWTPTRPLRALRKGRQVTLTGSAQANISYTAVIAQLPDDLIPSTNLYIPIVHEFAPSSSYNVFLRILPNGELRLYFTGSAPSYTASRSIYLDGVTFFLD